MGCLPRSNFLFCYEPNWLAHHPQKTETMETPAKEKVLFWSIKHLLCDPPIYLKGDNICQIIWDKSEVLLGIPGIYSKMCASFDSIPPSKSKNKDWVQSQCSLPKWTVNSGQSALHTKHNLEIKNTSHHPQEKKKGRPFTSWHASHWLPLFLAWTLHRPTFNYSI
jgi:hypothetical protein